jgi:hypothetical protein
MASATSLTMGAAIRKEKVTPSGTPASMKPIKSGTAEQEQKGVTTPSPAASTLPMPSRLPPSSRRVRSALKKVRMVVTTKIMPVSRRRILGTS